MKKAHFPLHTSHMASRFRPLLAHFPSGVVRSNVGVRRLSALRLPELALSPDCTLATISHYHQPGKSAGNSTRAMAQRPLGAGHVPTAPLSPRLIWGVYRQRLSAALSNCFWLAAPQIWTE